MALLLIIILLPVYLILAIIISIKLDKPVIFKQKRPGREEKIFSMYKFRSMSNECDGYGNLLPDECRLKPFGKLLRDTSLDELPELLNVLKGDMSLVGPRPQLVRDMLFMSENQRKRHLVRPGITGLAQINGRNCISWEEKINYDLEYINNITFINDIKILGLTVWNVLKQKDTTSEGFATAEDLGDYLLRKKKISKVEYDKKMEQAKEICKE